MENDDRDYLSPLQRLTQRITARLTAKEQSRA